MDRRLFLKYGSLSSVALPFILRGEVQDYFGMEPSSYTYSSDTNTLCVFIKPLEKYSYEDIAVILSDSGFEGADITFRKNGLILPEKASIELPKLVNVFQKKGLSIPMAVTGIDDADTPGTEDQIHLMADSGIRYYRLGYFEYDKNISIQKNLDQFKKKLSRLEALNTRHKIHGAIQNHVGTGLGASIWDAWYIIKDFDPNYIGFQYDIRHAMAEGMSSWSLGLKLILEYVFTTCIKDFTWKQDGKQFKPVSVPLGDGIVDFGKYFEIISEAPHKGPVSIHYEYPILTKEQQEKDMKEQVKNVISILKHDLEAYKSFKSNK
ncbi:MAG: sugar phosphate isomerase/epimerase [Tannerella sp.]|nr:sugar phosphate isomerase/epimerase [Tannerella sp.]